MEIKASNISVDIGNTHILKDVNIDVSNKQFIGIIGPNGSGKSTFLKCIYRVLKPTCGCVMIDNDNLLTMPVKESAKKIAVVAQHNYYNFDFIIEEVVMMGRSPHKKNMERDNAQDYRIVDDALEKVGMSSFKGRMFSTLSGGEQQRIILARALVQQTLCIILDEPTNHLDIKYQLQLMDIVKNLDITVVSAVHDLNIACMYCDYIYVMKNGEVVAQGKPTEILTKQLIYDVYEVEPEIIYDDNGEMHIFYHPMHKTSKRNI